MQARISRCRKSQSSLFEVHRKHRQNSQLSPKPFETSGSIVQRNSHPVSDPEYPVRLCQAPKKLTGIAQRWNGLCVILIF